MQRDATNTLVARMALAATNPPAPSELVITEIQYHPAANQDSGDWLELYNAGRHPAESCRLDLARRGRPPRVPAARHGLIARGYLVLCQEDSKFRLFHPATVVAVGNFQFGLGNAGDTLRLFRPDGTVALAIGYGAARPLANRRRWRGPPSN